MKLFPARYGGTCADGSDCFGEFEAGDMIGYDDNDELCCQACLMNQRGKINDNQPSDRERRQAGRWGDNLEVKE